MSENNMGRAGRMSHTLTVKEWRHVLKNYSHVYCGIKPPPGSEQSIKRQDSVVPLLPLTPCRATGHSDMPLCYKDHPHSG